MQNMASLEPVLHTAALPAMSAAKLYWPEPGAGTGEIAPLPAA